MRRAVLFLLLLLAGCGGEGSTGDGTVSLFFSDDADFGPSTIGITAYDQLEGSRDDGINVFVKGNGRTLEIDLPSGRTTDLETDLRASVFLHDPFGEAEGAAGTVTVLDSSDDRIWLELDDVVMADEDGTGEATLAGTVEVKNVVASSRFRPTRRHRKAPASTNHLATTVSP